MEKMLKFIRGITVFDDCFIIAGNVSTPEAVKDLHSWGANAIKIGVGPGKVCSTYMTTGFGSRGCQANILKECAKNKPEDCCLIIDGGIQLEGEISKAVALGANMVMAGGMFSGLLDSPGNIVDGVDGKSYKEYWGSASEHQSGKSSRIEGVKKLIPLQNKTFLQKMRHIQESLQSSISYGGGKSLDILTSVKYIIRRI
jgi:GMP reductase